MAFGQSSGPPATGKQVQALLALLNNAGHIDFRDARGPMGFTQRQANGKFTRDEADAFIEALEAAEHELEAADPAPPVTPVTRRRAPATATSPAAGRPRAPKAASVTIGAPLAEVPSEQLAAELQRRGWVVLEP